MLMVNPTFLTKPPDGKKESPIGKLVKSDL
jgi:hypothetical protein